MDTPYLVSTTRKCLLLICQICIFVYSIIPISRLPSRRPHPEGRRAAGRISIRKYRNSNGFSKKQQTGLYWKTKRNKGGESRAQRGHFGTYVSTQLPIDFENCLMKVDDLDLHFRQAAMLRNVKGMQRNCVTSLTSHLGGNADRDHQLSLKSSRCLLGVGC